MESRTQISENGNVILYEKRYHGVLTECSATRFLRNSDRIIEKK